MIRRILMVFAACLCCGSVAQSQGNIDWEDLATVLQPASVSHPTYGWMAGQRQYTGLAYDSVRKLLYVVNPALVTVGSNGVPRPTIRILDPMTLLPVTSVGRDAVTGAGGVLPVPLDTVVTGKGWPNAYYGGYGNGQMSLYKIDVDDEGRIWACNLVAPLFGICFPGPPPNCDSTYLYQGPLRIYRWDTPWSTPRRMYVTLDLTRANTGSLGNSDMSWSRWGDAFEVTGKRERVYDATLGAFKVVDKTQVYITGIKDGGQDNEILILQRDTTLNVSDGLGRKLEYRIARRLWTYAPNTGGNGLAVTGNAITDDIYTSTGSRVLRWSGAITSTSVPVTILDTLSSDPITGTGPAGPLSFFANPKNANQRFLLCADAYPTNPTNPPNLNTRARVMDVSAIGSASRVIGNTPYLGQNVYHSIGNNAYISDVDHGIQWFGNEPDCLYAFVLMANNGIATYRNRGMAPGFGCWLPVNVTRFTADMNEGVIALHWSTDNEQNNLGFEVQRRFASGEDWSGIGFVPGRGSTSSVSRYSYTDVIGSMHHTSGGAAYRLRQIDSDGSATYSHSVAVLLGMADDFSLEQNHPNPAVTHTDIAYSVPADTHVHLALYDALGREVQVAVDAVQTRGSHTAHIVLGHTSPGIYFWRLIAGGRTLQRAMVVAIR
ncbi:MAG: T9SS type A sorting domain-containing protein [Ignavibacteriae bacterium]|nr:T9SS type A sorting domain-containing protein [Ignavibacteriota bacterium]